MPWQNMLLDYGFTGDQIVGLKLLAILAIIMGFGVLMIFYGPEPNDLDY